MANSNQEYIDRYAEIAMEQQRLYGIPASVTLAQGILESANGKSKLAREGNNHFGIKASKAWLNGGGAYGIYTDDKPNEKFCHYSDVRASYEHHSQLLKNSGRYAACFKLAPDDYKGWCMGLDKAGYATSGTYGQSLIKTIERLDLQKYDKMAMAQMPTGQTTAVGEQAQTQASASYSMPVKREEFMLITSPFGMRTHPIDGVRKMHEGIDISTRQEAVLATENGGKVIKAGYDRNGGGGNYVKVSYDRPDGSKTIATYCHLSRIDVKEGDNVSAGQALGVSGSTGKSTGDHLHFSIDQVAADGTSRKVDSASYLAEIAQKGNLQTTALYNGEDLLAKYKTETPQQAEQTDAAQLAAAGLTSEDWMKKLLSCEDSGINLPGGDPIVEMLVAAFAGLYALAVQLDNKKDEEARQAATDAALTKRIDLTGLLPNMKSCVLTIGEGNEAQLAIDNGTVKFNQVLSPGELSRLSSIVNDETMDVQSKQRMVGNMINGMAINRQAIQNFEQISAGQETQQTLQR